MSDAVRSAGLTLPCRNRPGPGPLLGPQNVGSGGGSETT